MKLRITVHGVAYEVDVEVLDDGSGHPPLPLPRVAAPVPPAAPNPASFAPPPGLARPAAGDGLAAPIAGTVVKIHVAAGQAVAVDEPLLVVEAMKMNTVIASDRAGTVKAVHVKEGESVREGHPLVSFQG